MFYAVKHGESRQKKLALFTATGTTLAQLAIAYWHFSAQPFPLFRSFLSVLIGPPYDPQSKLVALSEWTVDLFAYFLQLSVMVGLRCT